MKIITTFLCLVVSLTTAMGQDVLRQRSNTRGLNLGLYGQYTNWATTSDDFKDFVQNTGGGGGGLRIGYGINHRLEVFIQVDGSSLSTPSVKSYEMTIAHLEAGGRLNIGSTTSRLRPFIDLAYSRVGTSISVPAAGTLNLYGGGAMGGVGVNYFLTIPIALNVRYSIIYGIFSQADVNGKSEVVDEKLDIGTGRLSLGLTWYLRGRR